MDWRGLQRQRNKEKGILEDGEPVEGENQSNDEYAELVLESAAAAEREEKKAPDELVVPLKVFVYGTLKKGCGNNVYLKNSTYIGSCWLDGFTMMHLGGIPAIFRSEGDCWRVRGEVYEIDTATLYALDRLEGIPTHYQREQVDCGNLGKAYVYTYKNPRFRNIKTYKRVINGEWVGMSTAYVEVTLKDDDDKDGKWADRRGNVVTPIRRFGERFPDRHGVLGPHYREDRGLPVPYVPPGNYCGYQPPPPIPKGIPAVDKAGFLDVGEISEPCQMCD